jgi:hypothetical protein
MLLSDRTTIDLAVQILRAAVDRSFDEKVATDAVRPATNLKETTMNITQAYLGTPIVTLAWVAIACWVVLAFYGLYAIITDKQTPAR